MVSAPALNFTILLDNGRDLRLREGDRYSLESWTRYPDGHAFMGGGSGFGQTPHYMSPEQATGERQLDARTDVYSLGAVLYEMLAGEPRHTGATAQAVIAKLMTERPTRLRVLRDTVPKSVDAPWQRPLPKSRLIGSPEQPLR